MIRLILLFLIVGGMASFAIKNAGQTLMLEYYFGLSTPPLPVYQVIIGAFLLGGGLVVILLIPEWIRLRLLLRRQRKALYKTERAIGRLKPREKAVEEVEEVDLTQP